VPSTPLIIINRKSKKEGNFTEKYNAAGIGHACFSVRAALRNV